MPCRRRAACFGDSAMEEGLEDPCPAPPTRIMVPMCRRDPRLCLVRRPRALARGRAALLGVSPPSAGVPTAAVVLVVVVLRGLASPRLPRWLAAAAADATTVVVVVVVVVAAAAAVADVVVAGDGGRNADAGFTGPDACLDVGDVAWTEMPVLAALTCTVAPPFNTTYTLLASSPSVTTVERGT